MSAIFLCGPSQWFKFRQFVILNPNLCASPQFISLVLRLSHRASRVFKAFSDDEVIKVLSALTVLGQHDEELLAAMEKHLPGEISFPPVAVDAAIMYLHYPFF